MEIREELGTEKKAKLETGGGCQLKLKPWNVAG
jgi:hypothetical protein